MRSFQPIDNQGADSKAGRRGNTLGLKGMKQISTDKQKAASSNSTHLCFCNSMLYVCGPHFLGFVVVLVFFDWDLL